jgi:N-acetyl sugar amidotransferase
MPNTKPGLVLDSRGYCQACCHYEMRKNVDWDGRYEELKHLTGRYKRKDGGYDSIIAVSSGKDSHYQVYLFKEVLGMNPLLVTVSDPFTHTRAGEHNANNILKAFNCDQIKLEISPDRVRRMMRIALENFGSPSWPLDRAIYAFPIKMALKLKIPLVVYGENVAWEYGGLQKEETCSAKDQINNDVAKKVDFSLWLNNGVKENELEPFIYPSAEEIERAELEPIFLSYFVPWDGHDNYEMAKRYGFRDLAHEWRREGYIEDYDQIDSVAYLFNVWMKYPKFGFSRATDVVGYWIRSGRISRGEGARLIRENDHRLDQRVLDDFLRFTGYTDRELWSIVDRFYNMEVFEKTKCGYRIREVFSL